MTIATIYEFRDFLRVTGSDLDPALDLALRSASAEVRHYLGFDPEEPDPDMVIACCLLAQTHVDAGSPEDQNHRREAAHGLLRPHRLDTGIAGA